MAHAVLRSQWRSARVVAAASDVLPARALRHSDDRRARGLLSGVARAARAGRHVVGPGGLRAEAGARYRPPAWSRGGTTCSCRPRYPTTRRSRAGTRRA